MLAPWYGSNGMTPMTDSPSTNAAPSHIAPSDRRHYEIRCASCGFGGYVTRPPKRCPMCGGSSWTVPALQAARPPAPWAE